MRPQDSNALYTAGLGSKQAAATALAGAAPPPAAGASAGDMAKTVYDPDDDGVVKDSDKLGGYEATQYARLGVSNTFAAAQTATAWETTIAGYLRSPSHNFRDNTGVTTNDVDATNVGGLVTFSRQGVYGAIQFGADLELGFYGATPAPQPTVTTPAAATAGASYGAGEQAMLQTVHDTLVDLITKLKTPGVIG